MLTNDQEIKCDVCRVGVKVFWSDMDKVDNPSQVGPCTWPEHPVYAASYVRCQLDKEAMARRFCNHPTGAMMNPYTTHEVAWANGNWTFRRKVVEDSEYAGQLTWRQDVILRACAQIAGNVAPQVFDTLVKAFDTPKHQATRKARFRPALRLRRHAVPKRGSDSLLSQGLTKQVCRELTRACKNRQLKAAHQEL
jgi:hypothetical protein